MMKTNTTHPCHQPSRLSLGRLLLKHFMRCSTLALLVLMCANPLNAQPPAAEPPAAAPPAAAATPAAANLPDVPASDIDFGTEEFEDFGEEDFQVEEKLSPATETTVTVIKVAVGTAIVLLFVLIAMKLLKRKIAVKP